MKNIKRLLILIILLLPFNVFADEININSTNAIMINLNNNKERLVYMKFFRKVRNILIFFILIGGLLFGGLFIYIKNSLGIEESYQLK